eukprot:c32241_g1_i1 orf=1-174(+)
MRDLLIGVRDQRSQTLLPMLSHQSVLVYIHRCMSRIGVCTRVCNVYMHGCVGVGPHV